MKLILFPSRFKTIQIKLCWILCVSCLYKLYVCLSKSKINIFEIQTMNNDFTKELRLMMVLMKYFLFVLFCQDLSHQPNNIWRLYAIILLRVVLGLESSQLQSNLLDKVLLESCFLAATCQDMTWQISALLSADIELYFLKFSILGRKTHTLLESSIRVTPQIVKGTFLHRMLSYLEWIWPGSTLSNQDPFSFNPSLLSLSVEARVGGQLKCLGLFSLTLLLHFVRLLDSSPLGSQHKYTLSQLLGCNFANEPWCN